jgi:hypothetical protein
MFEQRKQPDSNKHVKQMQVLLCKILMNLIVQKFEVNEFKNIR